MGIGRWRGVGGCGSAGEISAAATSWEPWPGCFLTISTYPKEKRSDLIHNLASSSFGGGCERSGCRRQVCVCGVGKWGAGRGPLVLHWPGWGWTLQGGCSSRGPAPLGTAGRVSLVPGAEGDVTLSILAPPPPPNKHPLSFEGTAQGFLRGRWLLNERPDGATAGKENSSQHG